jgi:hypothetical protein
MDAMRAGVLVIGSSTCTASPLTLPLRFYLITVEIEARGAAAVVPMMLATDAIQRHLDEAAQAQGQQSPIQEDDPNGSSILDDDDHSQLDLVKLRASSDLYDETLGEVVDERLLLPAVAIELSQKGAEMNRKPRSSSEGNESGSRRKRSNRPKAQVRDGARYIMSALSSSPKSVTFKKTSTETFPPNDALVGELSELRVAEYVTMQLERVALAVKGMCDSLESMKEGCHPFIFYHRVRPFLSAWKHVRSRQPSSH